MKSKLPALVAALAAGTFALSACGTSGDAASSGPQVVAAFYPLAFVAQRVGGNHVHVQNLTHPGVEPHDIELRPKQIGAVQDADLVVYEHGFQAAVDQAVAQASPDDTHLVDVADLIHLRVPAPDADTDEHVAKDPHVWLDPMNMVTITKAVADRLSRTDESHARAYHRNARTLVGELRSLDKAFRAGLRTCKRRTIVTSHAAFGYLAAAYHLRQIPIAGIDPSSEPSGAQLSDIARTVRARGVTTVFTEELVSPRVAQTVASETGAKTATLNPIEGLSDDTADQTYLTLMRHNLRAIQKADGCR